MTVKLTFKSKIEETNQPFPFISFPRTQVPLKRKANENNLDFPEKPLEPLIYFATQFLQQKILIISEVRCRYCLPFKTEQVYYFSLKCKPSFSTLMVVNSSGWANAVLPSQVCQDPCTVPFSNSSNTKKTRLLHAAFQSPKDSSQAQRQHHSPFSLVVGWPAGAESGRIPTGAEP